MKSYSNREVFWNDVDLAWRRICMTRHWKTKYCNSTVLFPICPKLEIPHSSPDLRTSTWQYWLIVIAPPTGNRKSALRDKHHPIHMKFTMCDLRHCARQSSGFIVPGLVGWRPARTPDARRGARARSSLLAALIIIIFILFLGQSNRSFEGLKVLGKWKKFAHVSGLVKNLIFSGSLAGMWQNGSIAPPTKLLTLSPSLWFHLEVWNLTCICNMLRRTKKPLGGIP